MIGVVLILGIVLSRTIAGRYMLRGGLQRLEASRLVGRSGCRWIKLVTFAISARRGR